jgi:hypothetical protein
MERRDPKARSDDAAAKEGPTVNRFHAVFTFFAKCRRSKTERHAAVSRGHTSFAEFLQQIHLYPTRLNS